MRTPQWSTDGIGVGARSTQSTTNATLVPDSASRSSSCCTILIQHTWATNQYAAAAILPRAKHRQLRCCAGQLFTVHRHGTARAAADAQTCRLAECESIQSSPVQSSPVQSSPVQSSPAAASGGLGRWRTHSLRNVSSARSSARCSAVQLQPSEPVGLQCRYMLQQYRRMVAWCPLHVAELSATQLCDAEVGRGGNARSRGVDPLSHSPAHPHSSCNRTRNGRAG